MATLFSARFYLSIIVSMTAALPAKSILKLIQERKPIMKHITRFSIAAVLLLAAAAAASAGTVTVKYQDPEKFMDVPYDEQDRTQMLKQFTEHFQRLGKRLPANQQLNITVTDIDLAGRVEPHRRHFIDDIRVLRGGA